MGWETRGNGRYYYRKERTASGRVRSVYVGGEGELLAHLYAEQRDDARRMKAALARIRARSLAPLDAALGALRERESRLRLWRDAFMVAAGHRRHRGQWRRRRGCPLPPHPFPSWEPAPSWEPSSSEPTPDAREGPPDMATNTPAPVRPGESWNLATGPVFVAPEGMEPERQRLAEAVARAEAAAESGAAPAVAWQGVADLRDALAAFPSECFSGVTGGAARRSIAALVSGADTSEAPTYGAILALGVAEAEMVRHARELAEDGDGPLVRAACEQAAHARAVLDFAVRGHANVVNGTYRLSLAEHWEKRVTSAQVRHTRAMATVALLRRAEREERRRMDRHVKAHGENAVDLAARELDRRAGLFSRALPSPEASADRPALPAHSGDSVPRAGDVELRAA